MPDINKRKSMKRIELLWSRRGEPIVSESLVSFIGSYMLAVRNRASLWIVSRVRSSDAMVD
jgi:hypothetical protein